MKMKVKEAIKKTLIVWDNEKYKDYINDNSEPNMELLFEIREDIFKEPKKHIDILGLDENDFKEYDDKSRNNNDGCAYTIEVINNTQQTINEIGLFNTKNWKIEKSLVCNINLSDNSFSRMKGYYYINEFDHWISYLIVRYLNDPECNVGSKLEEGIAIIRNKISCVAHTS